MLTRFEEERGVAMISVIMVTMVLVLLSVAAFQLSIGNISRSAYDMKRDRAIQAAQGAVNSYLAALPSTTKVCNGVGTSLTLSASPSVTYSVSRVMWSANGTTYTSCASSSPTTSQVKTLSRLVVVGSGTAGTGQQVVTRKWQSLIDLTPIAGGSVAAFYGNTGLCISNGPKILHDTSGNDATLYSGGDINTTAVCGSTTNSGNMVVEGNVYAQGSINGIYGCVEGNVWAGGSITLNTSYVGACDYNSYNWAGASITANSPPNPNCNGTLCLFSDSSGNAYGNTTAAGGSLTLSGSSQGYGYCRSSGTMSWNTSSARCSASRDPSNAYAPALCSGSIGDGTTGCGTSNMLGLTAPLALDTPNFTYAASDWSGAYTVVNESSGDCTAIMSDIITKITSGVSGKYDLVFYVNPGCPLSWPSNSSYALKGNTLIITKGSFSSGNTTLTTASGSCGSSATDNQGNAMYPNALCQFDVLVPSDTVVTPTSSCVPPATDPGTWDISFGNTTDMGGVDSLNYTPCQITLGQSSTLNGQYIAGVVNQANHFNLSFHPIAVPGFTPVGFNVAPRYFRECVSDASYC
jgi:Tfp pilus assembly protein PilX